MDNEGYPLPETLRRIENWEINSYEDCEALLVWIQALWRWGEYFRAATRREKTLKGGKLYRKWYVSTGGWSGHEDIITSMMNNWNFWTLAWDSSRRGGHYEFRV